MGWVFTSDAKPGMVLEQDALNRQGTLLLKSGRRLTEENISMLKSWGVPKLWIETGDETAARAESPSSARSGRDRKTELSARFEGVLEHPAMVAIFEAVCKLERTRSRGIA